MYFSLSRSKNLEVGFSRLFIDFQELFEGVPLSSVKCLSINFQTDSSVLKYFLKNTCLFLIKRNCVVTNAGDSFEVT